jgi:hypothetical protein
MQVSVCASVPLAAPTLSPSRSRSTMITQLGSEVRDSGGEMTWALNVGRVPPLLRYHTTLSGRIQLALTASGSPSPSRSGHTVTVHVCITVGGCQ